MNAELSQYMEQVHPDLTLSIINHSNPDLLRECLRSVYASTHVVALDVWVVDNATDGSGIEQMRSEFPQVHWLFNSRRLGFSANHNQVLALATGRYSCILNDDTIIHDGAIDTLVEFMDENSGVGMVGPRTLNPDGSQQNCTFRFMTLCSELIGIMQLPQAICGLKRVGFDPAQDGDQVAMVDWVLGACIVVRDSVIGQIGLLDDVLSPIANTEEVDWCYRAKQAGWKVAYCPAAVITHIGGQSMKCENDGPDDMRVEMYRTRLAFFLKHYGRTQALLLRFLYRFTLPWNMFMLNQSLMRGTISRSRQQAHLRTLRKIASLQVPKPARTK